MATIGYVVNRAARAVMWLVLGLLVVCGLIIVWALLTAGPSPMSDVTPGAGSENSRTNATQVITAFADANGFSYSQVRQAMMACKDSPEATVSFERLEGCIRAHIILFDR